MSDVGQSAPGWRWAPAWVLAFVALWPAPGYAEGVLALGALAGLSSWSQAASVAATSCSADRRGR